MKVSIITSCFNRAATIRGAIESVLAQDYNNIEFIVIDGASTDGSLEIIREYEDRISTIISEPDHGMYEAINKGIRVATGDVIGLLHSDDFFYDNGVISRIVEHMKTTRADFLYGDGLFVNPDNTDKVVRMRMGGLSTDSAKRKKMWGEDIRVYSSHGLWPTLTKLEKMAWKVPQFVLALLKG